MVKREFSSYFRAMFSRYPPRPPLHHLSPSTTSLIGLIPSLPRALSVVFFLRNTQSVAKARRDSQHSKESHGLNKISFYFHHPPPTLLFPFSLPLLRSVCARYNGKREGDEHKTENFVRKSWRARKNPSPPPSSQVSASTAHGTTTTQLIIFFLCLN